jgi:Xaa-Pro dipeptidase
LFITLRVLFWKWVRSIKERALRIFSKIQEPVDAILLMNEEEPMLDASFFYATGAESGLFEGCPAVLWPDGKIRIISSQLEETSAGRTGAEVAIYRNAAERAELLAEALKGAGRVGINGDGITYHGLKLMEKAAPGTTPVDIGGAIRSARMVKDLREIEAIRGACKIASAVADEIPGFLHDGMAEYETSAEIGYRMQKRGASGVSFDTIAAFGPGAAEPHYSPGDRCLRPGDPALFDFGCRYHRYCSDITRTLFSKAPTPKFRRMYETVLEAQALALERIRAGAKGSEVDAAARSHIDSSEFQGKLIHSVGHGLGLNVHDGGRLSPSAELILEENMVLTVEPGIYLPDEGGIRIEDDVRVTKNGYELLTSAGKALTVI